LVDFCGLDVLSTVAAVPLIVLIEFFRFFRRAEAVVNVKA
jgi:hypothetical protein